MNTTSLPSGPPVRGPARSSTWATEAPGAAHTGAYLGLTLRLRFRYRDRRGDVSCLERPARPNNLHAVTTAEQRLGGHGFLTTPTSSNRCRGHYWCLCPSPPRPIPPAVPVTKRPVVVFFEAFTAPSPSMADLARRPRPGTNRHTVRWCSLSHRIPRSTTH